MMVSSSTILRVAPFCPSISQKHGMQSSNSRRSVARAPRATPEPELPEFSAEEMIQKLLADDPAAKEQVGRVSDAARRVAELQMEQARLARALAEAEGTDEASAQLREQRATQEANTMIAAAEAKAAELMLRAAELEAEAASSARDSVAAQADIEAERVETAKAGAAAAAGCGAGSLPLILASSPTSLGALLSLGTAAASGFLFGLVYRYALRTDMANLQLKGGVVAAFGLVRGLGSASVLLNESTQGLSQLPSVESLGLAAAAMGESMLMFAFASVALEFAFQKDWVKPFSRDASRSGGGK